MNLNSISKLILLGIIFSVVIIVFFGVENLGKKDNKDELYGMLNRALVQCYALEGAFPEDIFYLEKYGINFDTDKYLYFYEPMGDLLPGVKIIELDSDFDPEY